MNILRQDMILTHCTSTAEATSLTTATCRPSTLALYKNMTDRQLTAIWTYVSTVPCNAHNDALGNTYPSLKNNCGQPRRES